MRKGSLMFKINYNNIHLNLECLMDSHCISSKSCMNKLCEDPCEEIDCTNSPNGKWCTTRNHKAYCTGKFHTTIHLQYNVYLNL